MPKVSKGNARVQKGLLGYCYFIKLTHSSALKERPVIDRTKREQTALCDAWDQSRAQVPRALARNVAHSDLCAPSDPHLLEHHILCLKPLVPKVPFMLQELNYVIATA